MIVERIVVGMMEVNCYVLAQGEKSRAILIDPGDEIPKIKRLLSKYNLEPAFIINTHGHIDHIGCDNDFRVPVYVHRLDEPLLKKSELNLSTFFMTPFGVNAEIKIVEDRQTITLDNIQLEVLHIPGHTPGGIALVMKTPRKDMVFTGDSLFNLGIGRTDFPGGNTDTLIRAIKEKLFTLPDDTIVYPGHGPSSTIGEEKKNNPFLTDET